MKVPSLHNLLNDVMLYPELRMNLLRRFEADAVGSKYRKLAGLLVEHDYDFTVDILSKFAPFDSVEMMTLDDLAKSIYPENCMFEDADGNLYFYSGKYGSAYLVKKPGIDSLIEMPGSAKIRKLF